MVHHSGRLSSSLRSRRSVFDVQGFVGPTMVFHANIIGVPITMRAAAAGPGVEA